MLGIFCYLLENSYDCLTANYQFRLATPSYDALSGSWKLHGQSYHNDAKHLITFAKQNHNSYLKVHIFKEYKAKSLGSIEHDLL